MAKFDYSKQLPQIFKDNGLGILPIKNGEYIIGKFNLFEKISKASLIFLLGQLSLHHPHQVQSSINSLLEWGVEKSYRLL